MCQLSLSVFLEQVEENIKGQPNKLENGSQMACMHVPKAADYSAECVSWQRLPCCQQRLPVSAAHLTSQPWSTQQFRCAGTTSAKYISRQRTPQGSRQPAAAHLGNVSQSCSSFFSPDTS